MLLLFGSDLRLNYNFTRGVLPSGTTFTRASTATYVNSSGVVTASAINEPRFEYDISDLSNLGLLYEEQRTNSVANNSMVGSTPGSPGTVATGWLSGITQSGITRTVIGSGTESGVPYVDIRYAGTATNENANELNFTGSPTVASVTGDIWGGSFGIKYVSGDKTNISSAYSIVGGYTSGGSFLERSISSYLSNLTTSKYTTKVLRTLTNATIGIVRLQNAIKCTNGTACDITLRIYSPQLEKLTNVAKPYPSSLILTTGTAVTRAADQLSFTIPTGINYLIYVFDDNSTQKVSVTAGAYTVPNTLNRTNIKSIYGV